MPEATRREDVPEGGGFVNRPSPLSLCLSSGVMREA